MKHITLSVFAVLLLLPQVAMAQQHVVFELPERALNFIVMGDPQPEEPPLEQTQTFLTIIDEVQSLRPDVVLIVGDLIRGLTNDTEQIKLMWDEYEKAVAPLDMPVLIAAGNHDIWDETSRDEFIERFGSLYHSATFGDIHFIMLNSQLPGEEYRIGPEQLAWLRNDLADHGDSKHIFVGVHAPLWAYGDHSNWMAEVHPLLKEYNVRGVFGGHWHIYQRSDIIDEITYYITGGAGGLMGDHSITSGEFHHYMHVVVRDDEVHYSVIKPGSVYSDSSSTKELSFLVHEIRDNVIGDPRLVLNDNNRYHHTVEAILTNPFETELYGTISWQGSVPFYTVTPVATEYSLEPGERVNLQFNLTLADSYSSEDLIKMRPVMHYTVSAKTAGTLPKDGISDSKQLIIARTTRADEYVGGITIDGMLDDWETDWPVRLDRRSQVTLVPERWSGPDEVSGSFAVHISDSYFYFAGTVVDDRIIHSARKHEPYQGDAVTLYLDLREGDEFQKRMFMEDVYAIIFVPECDCGDDAYFQTIYPYGTTLQNIRFASKPTDSGYTIEAAIPLEQLGGFDLSRSVIGFDVSIDNLNPTGTRTRMMWNGPYTNYMYGNKYGRLALQSPPHSSH
jgi:hypothetical protein